MFPFHLVVVYNLHFSCFSSVSPEEWEKFSNKNVLKAERERNSAVTVQSMIDEILQETFDDQQKQCHNVNLAFAERIEQTKKTKAKLEDHLAKVIEMTFLDTL